MMHKLPLSFYLSPLSIALIFGGNQLSLEPVVAKTFTHTEQSNTQLNYLSFNSSDNWRGTITNNHSHFDHNLKLITNHQPPELVPPQTIPPSSVLRDIPAANFIPLSREYAQDIPLPDQISPDIELPENNRLQPDPLLPEEPPSLEQLPETPPQPLPPPDELIPDSDQPNLPDSDTPSDIPNTINVESFEVRGSTVFSAEELAEITQPYTGRPLSFAELLQVRSAITQLYQSNGYINSGAFIPPQELDGGVVIIEIVEGGVEEINVEVDGRLRPGYVRGRLGVATKNPLNINRLVEALQLLRLDPLIENISSELSASPRSGMSILDVEVTTADSFDLRVFANNSRSPSVGSFRRGAGFTEANLLGFGDAISFDYNNTDGSDSFDVSYTFPLNARNGTLKFGYGTTASEVIEPPFDELDIDSESRYYELTYRQPIVQTPNQEFVLGLTASRQESETSLLDIPFPLSAGADDDGNTRVSAIRFFQEWLNRDENQVFAARSQFNFGVGLFDATVNSGDDPDSLFFSWRLQGQWVRLLAEDTLVLLRTDMQFANDPLPPLEQFRIGGMDSVRGYRQDLLLTDNGWFISAEARLPILRIPEWDLLVQATPFIDYGRGWNFSGENPDPNDLGGVGIGLRMQIGDSVTARFEWGIPWMDVDSSDRTWQEQGLYFSIMVNPF